MTEVSTPKFIIEQAERAFGLPVGSVLQRDRHRSTATCRNASMLLMRERGMSYPEIARALGLRDHTTIMSGVRSIVRVMEREQRVFDIINALRASVSLRPASPHPELCARCARTLRPNDEPTTS